ncbi:MAG: hypothetical protein JXA97_12875 [Anaerolineales bacterium]|nr:hypothetical protein [Anaerolineales bacterium]
MPKVVLHLLAGLMWSGVGIMLGRLAIGWLWLLPWPGRWPYLLAGLAAAGVIQFFFSRLATKNIARVERLDEKPCLFAFQAWTSYPLVLFMISLGLFLRNSPLPKPLLAILYIGIGGGLFLSSLDYYLYAISPHLLRTGQK